MYRQIMERVRQLVVVGDWPPGQEMPSIRQLAVALKISVITVKRAYLELEREGVIITRQGKGSMVAERPGMNEKLRRRELRAHLVEASRLAKKLDLSSEDLIIQLVEIHSPATEEIE